MGKILWKWTEMALTLWIIVGMIINAHALGRLQTIEALYCAGPQSQQAICR